MGNIKASIDRGTLENLVKTAESKDLSGYPAAKVEEFQAVLDAAKAVLENEDATIEEIREAVETCRRPPISWERSATRMCVWKPRITTAATW